MNILFVTATDQPEKAEGLKLSCEKNGIRLAVIHYDPPWDYREKLRLIYQYTKTVDITHFGWLDAHDCWVLHGPERIQALYESFNHPWVIAAETNQWPSGLYPSDYHPISKYGYLNSGAWIVESHYYRHWYESNNIEKITHAERDYMLRLGRFSDQGLLTEFWLNKPSMIKVDHECRLFCSTWNAWDDLQLSTTGKFFINNHANTAPAIIHNNGKGERQEAMQKKCREIIELSQESSQSPA